ncbi:EAL domain-containing protein [Sulfurimonas sp.]|uniref:EAL domain-containing protein n=1 Tax=Sulfurimonas sp. TaxID=2022749 RepID=UPI003D100E36
MWKKLSLKFQLIVFITLIVSLVEISTLLVIFKLQKQDSIATTKKEIQILTKSLKKDFLEVLLNPQADHLSDIKYRLDAFKDLHGVLLFNEKKEPIFQYKTIHDLAEHREFLFENSQYHDKEHFFVKDTIELENYIYGYIFLDLDTSAFNYKQQLIIESILSIFIISLIIGFLISIFLSKSYTEPFTQLLYAMTNSDPAHGKVISIHTSLKNEIKDIFNGYTKLMKQVQDSVVQLRYQANNDRLTNIKNRFFIEDEIKKALQGSNQLAYNLLHINLDQFQLVNNSAGHQAGDELLKMIAYEYSKIVPKNSIFARFDGDSFMVLMKDSSKENGLDFLYKSQQLLHNFSFSFKNEVFSISASIGMIHFKAYEYTFKELIKNVFSALHVAKSMGHNKVFVYDTQDDIQRFNNEISIANSIKEALGDGTAKFELYAQAIVPLQYDTDKISYEILIRMWDQNGEFIAPDNFLPTAQRYQMMLEIDIWVLWNYLEMVTKHPQHIQKLHSVHINVAGSSFTNPDFHDKLKEATQTFDFPWEKLELEITETSAINSFSKANDFIDWLKEIGIGLALDDFGTGMASFEYLKSMPFDVIKDMHNPLDKAVIKYIHEISALKGQETVAEYIEMQEDVDTLKEIGITYGQGYFLGKPKPLKQWL